MSDERKPREWWEREEMTPKQINKILIEMNSTPEAKAYFEARKKLQEANEALAKIFFKKVKK